MARPTEARETEAPTAVVSIKYRLDYQGIAYLPREFSMIPSLDMYSRGS